jgi:sugar lactone lactonase YvrE
MKKVITILVMAFCLNTNAQIITTVCGNGTAGYTGDGGAATTAQLNNPTGVAFDAAGNMYIADPQNMRIRKVTPAGIITTYAGNGTGGYSGDGGAATAAELYKPWGVAVDAAGNLYIADELNSRIRKVTVAGIITTIAGTGTAGYSGDGGQATAAQLHQSNGVAVDAFGNLYLADEGNQCIRKVNTAGIISTIAGGIGTGGYSGDGGAATAAELHQPSGVAVDAAGNMYIADELNSRIRKVNTAGIISTVAGNGTGGYSGDGGAATAAELYYPTGVALDGSGNMYIVDYFNMRIRKVNTAGIIGTIAGTGTAGYSGDGGVATAAELYYPYGVAIDASGNLYIADEQNNRIRMVSAGQTTAIPILNTQYSIFQIYPNPNNGNFIIETNSTANQTIQLYDVNGKMVLNQIINGKATTIDATGLNEGVYNISIINNEGVVNKRIVIAH